MSDKAGKIGATGRLGARLGGRISALLQRNRKLRRSEGLAHYVRLTLIRDTLLEELLAAGNLTDRKERLLSETNRQVESLGSRLGLIPAPPRAGGSAAADPESYLDDEEYIRRILTPPSRKDRS